MKKLFLFIMIYFPLLQLFPQWQMLNGPYETQGIYVLSKHPNGYLFAYGEDESYANKAIYRSTNYGVSWQKVYTDISNDMIVSIDFDPQGRIYAGSYGLYYYSTDFGNTWINKSIGQSFFIYSFVFTSVGIGFLGGSGGIYKSTNDGQVWANIFTSTVGDLFIDENDNIYAATSAGVYYSSNNGLNWSSRSNGLPLTMYRNIVRNSQGVLFLYAYDYGIYKSIDLGLNWNNASNSIDIISSLDLKLDQNDYLYLCKWNSGVYRSTNNGSDWLLLPLNSNVQCSIVDDQNNLYAGDGRALYQYSQINSAWEFSTLQKDLGYIRSFSVCSDSVVYASTSMRLWKSVDHGVSWFNVNDTYTPLVTKSLNNRVIISTPLSYSDNCSDIWFSTNINSLDKIYIDGNSNLYAGSRTEIYKSTNNGEAWNLIGDSWIYGVERINDINMNSSGHIFISQYGRFYMHGWFTVYRTRRSLDSGESFQDIYTSKEVLSIEVDRNDNIFLATNGLGILKSDSSATNWTPINSGLTTWYVSDLTFSPEGILLAATNDGVFRYWKDTNLWSILDTTGLVSKRILNLSYHNNRLYAGTDLGLAYYTGELPVELSSFTAALKGRSVVLDWTTASEVNNYGFEIQRRITGQDWIPLNFVQGNNTTTNQNTYSYVDLLENFNSTVTLSYRLKQIDFDGSFDFSDIVELDLPAEDFELYQNYPNPFNPTTSIRFSIPEKTNVTIVLYNILGEKIKTLISSEEKQPGNYTVEFDGRDYLSGVYFYSLITTNFHQVKKMILMR